MTTLVAAKVVTATAVHSPGWVEYADGAITGVGAGRPERFDRDLGDAIVVPGFVDMHVHGGGGGSYTDLDMASIVRAREAHALRGTTTTMASLVTLSPRSLLDSVEFLADVVADGIVSGIHLEGPWLSPQRCGAHDPAQLREPEPGELERLLTAGRGGIRMVTIAPELPGATTAIRRVVDAGAVAAVGHTDASYEHVVAAIEAGARVATHLFNAMRPLHHREPGPILALLEDPRVTLELIADGTHLHPELYRYAASETRSDRVALVTDAMVATGLGDGEYELGSLDVVVTDGVARLAGSDVIAGSTTTMDRLFAAAIAAHGGVSDDALLSAVHQTSTTPARAMGWTHAGDIAVGGRADLVVLDGDVRVVEVIRGQ